LCYNLHDVRMNNIEVFKPPEIRNVKMVKKLKEERSDLTPGPVVLQPV
jgi:hypothetical protein